MPFFFLKDGFPTGLRTLYNEKNDTYWTAGDFTGRYEYDEALDKILADKNVDALVEKLKK